MIIHTLAELLRARKGHGFSPSLAGLDDHVERAKAPFPDRRQHRGSWSGRLRHHTGCLKRLRLRRLLLTQRRQPEHEENADPEEQHVERDHVGRESHRMGVGPRTVVAHEFR